MADLRQRAGAAADALGPLVLSAQRLAAALAPGAHGLRRAGAGDAFWQYRPAMADDAAAQIDWRRSARSDARFVREREAHSPHALLVWAGAGPGMEWAGGAGRPTKAARARLLALALALAALRGGERVGVLGGPARAGKSQGDAVARDLLAGGGWPDAGVLRPGARLLILHDFLDDLAPFQALLARAADLGLGGVAMQILDPDEERFPYQGATRFAHPGGGAGIETREAADLRAGYLAALAARRATLAARCAGAGWHMLHHRTDTPATEAALALYQALAGAAR